MNKIKKPKVGEYVLVTRWSDKNPNDPWYVGTFDRIIIYNDRLYYKIKESQREWQNVFRITNKEGKDWLAKYEYLKEIY